MPYPPPTHFSRTDAEKRDPALSWARGDRAFFAAGACHILAYASHEVRPDGQIMYTHPLGRHPGNHVYVRVDGWAFDFAGWTGEDELLSVMRDDYEPRYRPVNRWICCRVALSTRRFTNSAGEIVRPVISR